LLLNVASRLVADKTRKPTVLQVQYLSYPYRGVPLTAAIALTLIRASHAGSGALVTTDTLSKATLDTHLKSGGAQPNSVDFKRSAIKKALQALQRTGEVEKAGYGVWRFSASPTERTMDEVPGSSTQDSAVPAIDISSPPSRHDPSGLYVFYYPSYAELAASQGSTLLPCKIGISDVGVSARVAAQVGTGMPERPVIGMVVEYPTGRARKVESAVHSVLEARGRRHEGSGGAEWFLTSVAEVCDLVRFIDPDDTVMHPGGGVCRGADICAWIS
jgi:hypothetical protein